MLSIVGRATVLAAVIMMAACSDDPERSTVAEDGSIVSAPRSSTDTTTVPTPPPTEPQADGSSTTASPDSSAVATTIPASTSTELRADDPVVELDAEIPGGGTPLRLLALGGIEFVVPAGHSVHHDGDMVLIRPSWEPDGGRYLPSAVIALVSQYGSTDELPTVESVTSDAIAGVGTAAPTGATIELLGRQLTGYRFEADPDVSIGPHYLFDALPRPAFGPTSWQPFPMATLFLADTPGGVLAVGAIGETEADLATASAVFEQVAPTITIDELRSRPADRPSHPSRRESPELVTAPDVAPEVLLGVVRPVKSGRYTLDKLGTPLEVTVPEDWWVQGNFPGHVVLTGDESFGPGDRSVTFITGHDHLVAISSDYAAIGEPLPLAADSRWPADRFPTLLVGTGSEVDLDGVTAERFDVRVDPDADCSESEPCEFHLLSAHFGPGETIRKGYFHRVWQLHDGVSEPITIVAVAADESWLSNADAIVASLRFDW
jgi:hypothetical protein